MLSDNFLLRSELPFWATPFFPVLDCMLWQVSERLCFVGPTLSSPTSELNASGLPHEEHERMAKEHSGSWLSLTHITSHLVRRGPETQRTELKPDHGAKAMTDFRFGREKLILGAVVTDGMSSTIVCLSVSVFLHLQCGSLFFAPQSSYLSCRDTWPTLLLLQMFLYHAWPAFPLCHTQHGDAL